MKTPRYPTRDRELLGRQKRRKLIVRGGRLTRKSIKGHTSSDVARDVDACEVSRDKRRRHVPAEIAVPNWMAQVLATGAPVPANPTRPNAPWFAKIASDAHANIREIADASKPYRAQILAFADKVGLDRSCSYDNGPITIKEICYVVCATTEGRLAAEKRDEKSIKAALANTRTAFNHLVPKYAGEENAPALPAIEAALADRALTAKCLSELRGARKALEEFLDDGLPPDFTQAIQIVCTRFDIGGKRLADLVGTNESTLWAWRYGRLHPTTKSKAIVNKIESLAALPKDALWERCKFVERMKPQGSAETKPNLLPAPPAFKADWPLKLDPLTDKYIYRKPSTWPAQLADERDAFLDLHSNVICPEGMKRESEEIWAEGSQSTKDAMLGRLFGFMGADNGKFEPLEHAALSFVFLCGTKFLREYIAFGKRRRVLCGKKPRLTSADKQLVEMCRAMFAEEYGFLTQRPDLAARLKPVKGLHGVKESWFISPEDVALAQSDWQGFCRKALKAHDELLKSHAGQVTTESSHDPFKAVLELKDPLVAFRLGKAGLDEELAKLRRDTITRAVALRDRASWVIQSQCAFRPRTLHLIDYLEDNSGHLRDYGDTIELFIARTLFKNSKGPYFKDKEGRFWDYHKVLEDVDGAYDAIREYLREGLPLLRIGKEQAAFHISVQSGRGRLLTSPVGNIHAKTYRRHVLYDAGANTGIPGTKKVEGCHWMRSVLATGVLKLTLNEQLAADAIHDSVDTIREHYVRYLPRDRAGALSEALRIGLSGGVKPDKRLQSMAAGSGKSGRGRRHPKSSTTTRMPLAGRLRRR